MSDAQAVIILIDNSSSSIDGDFYPNRLDAQRLASDRLFQYFTRQSAKTQIGLGTIGTFDFGISASLTTRLEKVSKVMAKINRGGKINFEHGVRCAYLALRHRDPQLKDRKIIVFIGTDHGMTPQSAAKLASDLNKEGVGLDIVAIGDQIHDMEILMELVKNVQIPSHFVHAKSGTVILSDIVLSSPIGPGEGSSRTRLDVSPEEDPEVALAIRQSLEGIENNNDEIEEAIRQSLAENNVADDPELEAALRASLDAPSNTTTQSFEDIDDPELIEAMKASLQVQQEQDNNSKESNVTNPEELNDILSSLPGVDPNDPMFKKKEDQK